MSHQWTLLPVLMIVVSIANAQGPDRYSLRGRLVDGSSGQPLGGIPVLLTKEHDQSRRHQISATDGAFSFPDLEPDRYLVAAIVDGEHLPFYEFPDAASLNVWVGPDQKTQDFVFPVRKHARVSGTVRDEFGDPIANAKVIVYREDWRNGKTVLDLAATQETDDRGRYRILDLAAAKYLVCASPTPGVNDLAPLVEDGDFAANPELRIHARTCFPGEPPNTLRIDLGQEKTVDFKLGSVAAVRVQGTISPISQQSYVTLVPIDAEGLLNQQGSLEDGRFEFSRVEPSQYRLETRTYQTPVQSPSIAIERITVEKGGLRGIQLTLRPLASIEIAVEGAADLKIPHPAQIGLLEPDTAQTLWSNASPDGAIRFENLTPGRYWLVKRMTEPYCVESATLDGEDVLYRAFNVAPGASARLRIKVTTQCGSFSVTVLSRGKPAYMATIAVLITGTPNQPGDVATYSTNETGNFSITLLPPGRYLVWAWRQTPSYAGPPSLKDAERFATVVDLSKGQKVEGIVLRDLEEVAR